jgi:cation diffusion facilitator CzcD-associated flavoprotein CzcO
MAPRSEPQHEVVVIGAGFSGIGAAIALKRAGIDDFVIFERADAIGGTWRDNTYPNVAVDIPSLTYQFSFEMNPDWSRLFAPGAEVWAYAEHCVDKYGLRDHLRLGQEVTTATFDERNDVWRLRIGRRVVTTRFLICALGALTQPKAPDIPGVDKFAGTTVHTARWDPGLDLGGQRVGVIGTGATAVQLVPWIADRAAHTYVFQRTPIWVLPKPDVAIPAPVRAAFKYLPFVQDSVRLGASAAVEVGMVAGVIYNRQAPAISRGVEQLGRAWLRRQVAAPVLRDQLTPRYGFGCKRPSFSNDYYRTFTREDTTLVTDPIARITPTGIRTKDGEHRKLDTLVLATGFLVSEPENTPSIPLTGRAGLGLREFWHSERFQAYHGTSVPGFPNLFSIFGPYAATGSSWMFMVEYQSHHAVRVIKEARKRRATAVEVRQEPHDRYFADILRRQQNTIFFNNNCGPANSYYFDHHGDAPFLRPATALESWWRSRRFDLDDYRYALSA